MRSKICDIITQFENAKIYILSSLRICANDHVLSAKLLDRFSRATGSIAAIVGDWFDFDRLASFDSCPAGSEGEEYAKGERPTERLVAFVSEFLDKTENAIVICENWGAERRDIANWIWPPPRVACLSDKDVYHILTKEMNNLEMIEATVVPRHYWQTGICSTCHYFPDGDIPNHEFIDNVVYNTRKIFIPAFDNTGYLIWTLGE